MTGKILIIDSVATNRIILKVKLVSAQYSVETCEDSVEAKIIIAGERPDLVVVNLSNPTEDLHEFCRQLRNRPDARSTALVAIGVADTSRARFSALDCGCDDVLPVGTGDAYMMARLRSLLRRHSAVQAWQMRDVTHRALGFDEAKADRLTPPRVAVVSNTDESGPMIAELFNASLGLPVGLMSQSDALSLSIGEAMPDLVIIDGTHTDSDFSALFQLIADLNARGAANFVSFMVLIPQGRLDVGAMLLDLGADDVVEISASQEELCLRAHAVMKHKFRRDVLREQVRSGLEAAVIDPLTGLHNRRFADMQMDRIADHALEHGQGFAVMVVDIDHFKTINDNHGHTSGDTVLREIAIRFRANFRDIDLIARIGGEEFLVAMPDTDEVQAGFVAERLRRVIAETPFLVKDGTHALKVTISVGVAMGGLGRIDDMNGHDLFARADAALFTAKGAGRDNVVMAQTAA